MVIVHPQDLGFESPYRCLINVGLPTTYSVGWSSKYHPYTWIYFHPFLNGIKKILAPLLKTGLSPYSCVYFIHLIPKKWSRFTQFFRGTGIFDRRSPTRRAHNSLEIMVTWQHRMLTLVVWLFLFGMTKYYPVIYPDTQNGNGIFFCTFKVQMLYSKCSDT